MTILGIDPGFGITGYGVIKAGPVPGRGAEILEAGILKTNPKKPLGERLLEIHRQLTEILKEFSPRAMAVENTFSVKAFPRSGIFIGYVQGIVLMAAAQRSIPVFHYYPLQVKKALTGSGHATKAQIQRMVQSTFQLREVPKPDDVADALAVALCHAGRSRQGLS